MPEDDSVHAAIRSKQNGTTAKSSNGIATFTGESLGDVGEMMSAPEFPGQMPDIDFSAVAGGSVTDILFRDGQDQGFSLTSLRLAPDYILPSHHHDVDCLYYVESGLILLGRRIIDRGGGFLVRAGTSYGYQAGPQGATVLEFRNSTNFNMIITETSPTKLSRIAKTAVEHDGWPGFLESVALPRATMPKH
jgi:mannose-6-phosphate isomerase-like protein (cupin superfamily)